MTLFEEDNEGGQTIFRDTLTLICAALLCIIFLLIPLIHDPERLTQDIESPGGVMFTIAWEDGSLADIDMWITQPNPSGSGSRVVSYQNSHSPIFDMLQDDLGATNDTVTPINSEYAFARELVDGHYVFRIKLYGLKGENPPLAVRANLTIIGGGSPRVLIDQVHYLMRQAESQVVIEFDYIDGTITNIEIPTYGEN